MIVEIDNLAASSEGSFAYRAYRSKVKSKAKQQVTDWGQRSKDSKGSEAKGAKQKWKKCKGKEVEGKEREVEGKEREVEGSETEGKDSKETNKGETASEKSCRPRFEYE